MSGLVAISNWAEIKNDIVSPIDALGAALHREKHPTKPLDGVSCGCWDRAAFLIELLAETPFYLVQRERTS